jgi:phosphate transport system substrate-binding protein
MSALVRFVVMILVSVFVLPLIAGCGPSSDSTQSSEARGAGPALTAAGSSFAAPIFNKWIEVYVAAHPELGLTYDSVGSGEGIDRFLAGTVDIGATDAPLLPEAAAGVQDGVVQIPVTAGMIAIAYNLPGIQGPLNLPRDVYPDIFRGTIYRWDDPRIAAANPGMEFGVAAQADPSRRPPGFERHHLCVHQPSGGHQRALGQRSRRRQAH